MQKYILLRGHQGSGKSTFAQEKIQAFQRDFPNAHIFHIENDLEMTDENGIYHFSNENVAKAREKGLNTTKFALKLGQKQPETPILIINSNTNQKASACRHLLDLAKKHHFKTEVYRLHNFYPNIHRVPEYEVLSAYIRLNNNALKEEIHVAAVAPISAEIQKIVDEMQQHKKRPLAFDENQQTFVTPEYLRLGRRDFTMKNSRLYPELRVLKYARSVFYENRFDAALLEMRGLIMDEFNHIIVRPFQKVFNYSERIAKNSPYPIDISDNHLVDAVVKVNGFLGCCTYVDLPENHPSFSAAFNQRVLYSTTGSLDSDFAKMTQKHCFQYEKLFKQYPNHTFLFEITDEQDVHIIRESFGETLIGVREVQTGRQWTEAELNQLAKQFNQEYQQANYVQIKRPEMLTQLTFGELKQLLKTVKHEGFMVFDTQTQEMLFKLKSPFYLISKFFGRSNEKSLNRKLDKRHLDEEFYPLVDYIQANQSTFNGLSELDKIQFIQYFINQSID